jgi:VanZ family protein
MNFKSKSLWLFITYLLLLICNSFFSFSIIPYKDIWKYDKLIHFSEYFILGVLYINALYNQDLKINRLYPILFISLIPIIDECIQFYVPSRISSIYDALFDYLGCYIGMGLYYSIYRYKNG